MYWNLCIRLSCPSLLPFSNPEHPEVLCICCSVTGWWLGLKPKWPPQSGIWCDFSRVWVWGTFACHSTCVEVREWRLGVGSLPHGVKQGLSSYFCCCCRPAWELPAYSALLGVPGSHVTNSGYRACAASAVVPRQSLLRSHLMRALHRLEMKEFFQGSCLSSLK